MSSICALNVRCRRREKLNCDESRFHTPRILRESNYLLNVNYARHFMRHPLRLKVFFSSALPTMKTKTHKTNLLIQFFIRNRVPNLDLNDSLHVFAKYPCSSYAPGGKVGRRGRVGRNVGTVNIITAYVCIL